MNRDLCTLSEFPDESVRRYGTDPAVTVRDSVDSIRDATVHESEQAVKAVFSLADGEVLELDGLQAFYREPLDPAVPDSTDAVGTRPQTPDGTVDTLLRGPHWE